MNLKLLSNYSKSNNIDYELQVRLKKYYQFLWEFEEEDVVEKEQSILKHLSSNLREEVIMQTRGRFLDNYSVFKNNFTSDALRKISHIMRRMRYAPNDVIFQVTIFMRPDELYIMIKIIYFIKFMYFKFHMGFFKEN
jgi:hypothetical protein